MWNGLLETIRHLWRRWRGTLEEFVDVDVPIESYSVTGDGVHILIARGQVDGGHVAIQVEVGATWEPWHLEEHGLTLWRGDVSYVSLGADSDSFVHAIARLYNIQTRNPPMLSRIRFTAIALNGNPLERLPNGAEIKCFFESASDDCYAEFYTNIYPDAGHLEFHEKDLEYRRPLIRAFTVPGHAAA